MSVTINKPISKVKELFMAICLLSGKISFETIRLMKMDYDKLQCIIDSDYSKKIDDTFIVTFELAFYGISYSYQQFRYRLAMFNA